ncbi:MAG: PAS domain-containing protein [Bacteroidota bacterium]
MESYIGSVFTEHTLIPCLVWDQHAQIVFSNPAFCTLCGYSKDELEDSSLIVLHADSNTLDDLKQLLTKKHIEFKKWVISQKNGEFVSLTISCSTFTDSDGNEYRFMLGNAASVTSSPETDIIQDLSNFRDALKIAKTGVFQYSLTNGMVNWSQGIFDIYELDSTLGMPSIDEQALYLTAEVLGEFDQKFKECADKNRPFDIEYDITLKDGRVKHLRTVGLLDAQDADDVLIRGIVQDITGEMRVQNALEESNRWLEEVEQTARIAGWSYDVGDSRWNWTKECFRMHGFEPDVQVPPPHEVKKLYSEGERARFSAFFEGTVNDAIPFEEDFMITIPGGHEKVIHIIANPIIEDQRVTKVEGTVADVTERVKLQEEIFEVKAKTDVAVKGGKVGLWDLEMNTGKSYFNDMWFNILGYEPEDAGGDNTGFFFNILHPEDAHLPKQEMEDILAGKKDGFDIEIRLRGKNGTYHWVADRARVSKRNPDGSVAFLSGSHHDITSIKEAQFEIKRSEEQYRFLAETLPHILWTAESSNSLTYMNKSGLDYFGETFENLTNDKWLGFIHPDDFEELAIKYYASKEQKTAFENTHRLRNKDGEYRWFNVITSPHLDDDGQILVWVGLATDVHEAITARQSLEMSNARIQNSLKEKETLLQEIHHRVKNNLSIVSGLLHLQIFKSKEAIVKESLRESQSRIRSIAAVHELLYQAEDFSQIDLKQYYEKLIDLVVENFVNEKHTIIKNLDIRVKYLSMNHAIPLALLLNELLTNSAKYAMTNNQCAVTIEMQQTDRRISVLYKDSGSGFDLDAALANKTLGLEIMHTLLRQLEASYSFHTDGTFELAFSFEELMPKTAIPA